MKPSSEDFQLPKAYEARDYEDDLYQRWEESGSFKPVYHEEKEPFVITLPPPNATGILHLGHAVMLALEDIMIRFHRMNGHPTLWVPGTDHAGIATQNKVEKDTLDTEGKTRYDYGREAFVKKIEDFVANSQDTIRKQTRRMGASCDWSREKYTLEPSSNKAVNEFFKRMYEDGLIYRGDRIVNWDPNLHTTVSDDELEYTEEQSPFYTFQYGPFEIATARPETKFGDKYVVMHPDDERYTQYKHGDTFECEWINGPIQSIVIKDEAVDPSFGTGVMTITPWHDVTDFEIAERHGLEKQQIIDFDGNLMECAGEFKGMNIKKARPLIVEKLQKKGLLIKTDKEYIHNVATSYRGGGVIEPQIMKQWFVDVKRQQISWKGRQQSIKEVLHDCVQSGMIQLIPNRFDKTYFNWIENLRDWCISRQLWWGHQIPMWYKVSQEDFKIWNNTPEQSSYMLQVLGIEAEETRFSEKNPAQEGEFWIRDPDCLDTWFSSALWTFSTLGWPEHTEDFLRYHPTSVLETGYDIIFFWVARMILASTYCLRKDGFSEEKSIPFKTVYLHGLVRTRDGKKMSKSKPESCIDPLEMIDSYGADALRLSLFIGSTPGNDTRLYQEKIAGYRNFVNKLWNVSRFILMNLSDYTFPKHTTGFKAETLADQWILSRMKSLISSTTKLIKNYQFSAAAEDLYAFTWSELADWYLEIAKIQLKQDHLKTNTQALLYYVLKTLLSLWHPFTPFVTEALWPHVQDDGSMLINETWPVEREEDNYSESEEKFELLKKLVVSIRNTRAEYKVEPAKRIPVLFTNDCNLIVDNAEVLQSLARLSQIKQVDLQDLPKAKSSIVMEDITLYLPFEGMVDVHQEKERLNKKLQEKQQFLDRIEAKLSNTAFVKNAPKQVIKREKENQDKTQIEIGALKHQLEALGE